MDIINTNQINTNQINTNQNNTKYKNIRLSKKRIGSREAVFKNLADKTSGGMYKDDIIEKITKNQKRKYISKKISNRMKYDTPLRKKKKKSLKQIKNCLTQQEIINKPNTLLNTNQKYNNKNNDINNLKKSKKVSFISNKNILKEYYCDSMEDEISSDLEDADEEFNLNLQELNSLTEINFDD
tara:strand:+ start:5129 stop:5677 length:549 start_codon:yes stop_codon:yes gene_type:complete